ncbi:Glyoxylate reductase/hydroxypyruvate reductase [Aphelenchoides bicaudatus]|nr:Glyoxylate reductase/hydroxypyruvate reductase [Aphelenchoides bicaudatus]
MLITPSVRPIVLIANKDLQYDRLKDIADLIINEDASGATREWVMENIGEATAFFFRGHYNIDAEVLDKAKNLKYLVTIAVGHDNIDLEECKKRNIKVGYAGPILTEGTAEMCMALLLSIARRVPEAVQSARNGGWNHWSLTYLNGKALEGSTVGFYGLGRIGESTAEKVRGFHPQKIIYHNRKPKENKPQYEYVSFDELLKQSDFLIITASAGAETAGIFNKKAFGQMKNDSVIVNISRGKVIKTDDLLEALKTGQIGAAALDVTEPEPLPTSHELYKLDNCIITPHIGSGNVRTRKMQHQMGEDNVFEALNGRPMPSPLV